MRVANKGRSMKLMIARRHAYKQASYRARPAIFGLAPIDLFRRGGDLLYETDVTVLKLVG